MDKFTLLIQTNMNLLWKPIYWSFWGKFDIYQLHTYDNAVRISQYE